MSNNKQSSVEWLVMQLWEQMNMQGDGAVVNEIFEQAKAMHKQEIEQAFDRGRLWNMSWDGNSYYEEIIIKGNDE